VRAIFALIGVLVLAHAAAAASAAPSTCATYDDRPLETGRLPPVLPELSGLAASRQHAGIYWAHNDSGHALEVYAIRGDGTLVATFAIHEAVASDLEDIAVGPCTPTDPRVCLYLADTGDNLRSRSRVQILRVVEPATLHSGPLIADTFSFTYPDGAHDAEALLVDPRTAEIYVVTKSIASLGTVYRIDRPGIARQGKAVRGASLSTPGGFDAFVTGASVHPSGTRILLRTYLGVWEYRRPGARGIADVLEASPTAIPGALQPQGEAITYTADGTSYVVGSEGAATSLFRIRCRQLDGQPARE